MTKLQKRFFQYIANESFNSISNKDRITLETVKIR